MPGTLGKLGKLFIVATPIGNLEDITLRALRVLREVAVIAAEDTRRTAHLLQRHAIATPTTSLHEHNEHAKTAALIARLERGESVALVSDAGTPTVSDPGTYLIRQAVAAGVQVEPVPGPSAILTVLAASGFPTDHFAFIGFPPSRATTRNRWFDKLPGYGPLVIFFEAPHRIHDTLHQVARVAPEAEVVIGRELTKAHEELVRGPISTVSANPPIDKGEFVVAIMMGQPPDIERAAAPDPGASRRELLASAARAFGVSANALYDAVQRLKESGE